jgi:hypothetical protein
MAKDIETNGLLDPIWLMPDGSIIDGKTRYEACLIAKVEPRYETYTGDDPFGFVVSQNLRRRHLSVQERAEIAATMANLPRGDVKTSVRKITDRSGSAVSTAQAAKLLGVSTSSVEKVKAKRKTRPNKPEAIATAMKVVTGKFPDRDELSKVAGIHPRSADNTLRVVKRVEEVQEAQGTPIELRFTKAQELHIEARIKAEAAQLMATFNAAVEQKVNEILANRDKQDIETIEQANTLLAHSSGRLRPPFTAEEYASVLLRALHPDTSTPENRLEAFKLVNNKKLLLRDEGRIELRGPRLPTSVEEWKAAKVATAAARKRKKSVMANRQD